VCIKETASPPWLKEGKKPPPTNDTVVPELINNSQDALQWDAAVGGGGGCGRIKPLIRLSRERVSSNIHHMIRDPMVRFLPSHSKRDHPHCFSVAGAVFLGSKSLDVTGSLPICKAITDYESSAVKT